MAWWNAKNKSEVNTPPNQTIQNTAPSRREDPIESMIKYEELRRKIRENDAALQQAATPLTEIRDMLEELLSSQGGEEEASGASPADAMLMQVLAGMSAQGGQQQAAPPTWEPQNQARTAAPQAPGPQPQQAPQYTEQDVENIIALVPEKYLKMVRKGQVTEEQVVSLAKMRGISEPVARAAYAKVRAA